MTFTAGLSYLLEGDPERADAGFVPAFDATMHAGQLPFAAVILAERCIAAAERHDWTETEELTSQAVSIVQDGGFDDYWTSAVVYAWAAREALHRGKITKGRDFVARAARLRGLLTYALPVVSVQTLIELARSYVALGDRDGAKTVLRQATDILRVRPSLGQLPDQVEEVRRMVERIPVGNMGASSLTGAELASAPVPADPPHLRGDRRPAVCHPQHGEDPNHVDLPEIGCLLEKRRHRQADRDRSARVLRSQGTLGTIAKCIPTRLVGRIHTVVTARRQESASLPFPLADVSR